MGGHAAGDGLSAIDTHMGNCAMMSAEALGVEAPLRVLQHRIGARLRRRRRAPGWTRRRAPVRTARRRSDHRPGGTPTRRSTRRARGARRAAAQATGRRDARPRRRRRARDPGQGRGPAAAARRRVRAALERWRRLGRPASAPPRGSARRPSRRLHHGRARRARSTTSTRGRVTARIIDQEDSMRDTASVEDRVLGRIRDGRDDLLGLLTELIACDTTARVAGRAGARRGEAPGPSGRTPARRSAPTSTCGSLSLRRRRVAGHPVRPTTSRGGPQLARPDRGARRRRARCS